jgi:hypothetical protein
MVVEVGVTWMGKWRTMGTTMAEEKGEEAATKMA